MKEVNFLLTINSVNITLELKENVSSKNICSKFAYRFESFVRKEIA